MVSIVSRKNPKKVIEVLAENGPLSKWQLKEKAKLEYPRVHEAVSKLENDGYVKVYDTMTSDKGLTMKIYGLTFRGVTAYLASVSLVPPLGIGEPGEDVEAFKKRYAEEKSRYLTEVEKLVEFLKSYGELLDYAIFKENRWLAERYGHHVYHDILDVAKLTELYPPFPPGALQLIKELKKQRQALKKEKWQMTRHPSMQRKAVVTITHNGKTEEIEHDHFAEVNEKLSQTEQQLEILLDKENEWWKRGFAVRFAQRTHHLKAKGEMRNENLHRFFRSVAQKIRKLELEDVEKMADIFNG